jgi:hypothetical protein
MPAVLNSTLALGLRILARIDAAEHPAGAETEKEEAAAPDVARKGEDGGGPRTRMALAAMGRRSKRWSFFFLFEGKRWS